MIKSKRVHLFSYLRLGQVVTFWRFATAAAPLSAVLSTNTLQLLVCEIVFLQSPTVITCELRCKIVTGLQTVYWKNFLHF